MTLIASGYTTKAANAIEEFNIENNFSIELFDLRIISPIDYDSIFESISKTRRYIVIDGGWKTCNW